MQNVKTAVKNGKLLITINLKAKTTKSASGKTLIIASTKGNQEVDEAEGVILGINCYRYPDSE